MNLGGPHSVHNKRLIPFGNMPWPLWGPALSPCMACFWRMSSEQTGPGGGPSPEAAAGRWAGPAVTSQGHQGFITLMKTKWFLSFPFLTLFMRLLPWGTKPTVMSGERRGRRAGEMVSERQSGRESRDGDRQGHGKRKEIEIRRRRNQDPEKDAGGDGVGEEMLSTF